MITVWTGNKPRHIHLINRLSEIDDVCAIIQEFDRVHTDVNDPIMDEYFRRMNLVEKLVFGDQRVMCGRYIVTKELSDKIKTDIPLAFTAKTHVVFGCGQIEGALYNMIKDSAIRIHMGVGYRGASCNMFAIHEGRKHLVGATIQKLSDVVEGGDPLFYAYGAMAAKDPFMLGMSAVYNAIEKTALYLQGFDVDMDAPSDPFTAYKYKKDFTVEMARDIIGSSNKCCQ